MGALSLRRRRDIATGSDIFEIKLGDEFLMSSRFTASEIALARLGLAPLSDITSIDVLVGGLGLGYTARAVLEHRNVRSLTVLERLPEVIEWHRKALVPLGAELTADPRCRLIEGDFFGLMRTADPCLSLAGTTQRFHAIIVDIDHSPRQLLDESHAPFYTTAGLAVLAYHLHPGGVFSLWSNDPPDEIFLSTLREVFSCALSRVVYFPNSAGDCAAANTVYVACNETGRL